MKPKVSVIMPVLNGEKLISEAIQSVLAQTYGHYELVVIDDGSTDGTREQVQRFADKMELKYVHHETPWGIARSMNDGIRNASGDLISFLDHDDAWFPEFLEIQISYLLEYPDVGMVHSDFQTMDVDGNVIEDSVAVCRRRTRPSGHVFPQLLMDSFIVGNSVLIRRECFARLGLFDESLRWGDYHMWMRIARHYRVDYVSKVLTKYRQHSTQSTRSVTAGSLNEEPVALKAINKILEAYPEVRREMGERAIRRRMASLYFDLAYIWCSKGAAAHGRACLNKAIRLWPANWRYFVLYMACLLPGRHAETIRRGWRRLRGGQHSV